MNAKHRDPITRHQIKIAKSTLRMSKVGAMIMGGMNHEQAREILRKHNVKFKEDYDG